MFGECHAHMLMDGIDYREAVKLHRESVCESKIREYFEAYRRAGVAFVRDGGDNCGVSRLPENMGSIIGHRFLLSIKKDIMAGLSDENLAI